LWLHVNPFRVQPCHGANPPQHEHPASSDPASRRRVQDKDCLLLHGIDDARSRRGMSAMDKPRSDNNGGDEKPPNGSDDEAPETPTDEPPPIPIRDPPSSDAPVPPLTVFGWSGGAGRTHGR
jgi:hypothetical protein